MKNLPDEELFKELEGRLQGYEEQPDDGAWGNISEKIPHDEPTWMKWADRSSLTIALLLLSLVFFGERAPSSEADQQTTEYISAISDEMIEKKTNGDEDESSEIQRNKRVEHRPTVDHNVELPMPRYSSPEKLNPTTAHTRSDKEPGKTNQGNKANDNLPALPSTKSGPYTKNPGRNAGKSDALSGVPTKADDERTSRSQNKQNKTSTLLQKNSGSPSQVTSVKRKVLLNSAPLSPGRAPVSIALPPADRHEGPVRHAYDSFTFMGARSWMDNESTLWYASPAYAGNAGGGDGGNVSASGAGSSKTIVKPKPKQRRPVDLYFLVTPTLAYYSAVANVDDGVFVKRNEELSTFSKTRRAFSIETGVQFPIYKRVSAIAGLTYYYQNLPVSITRAGTSGSTSSPAPGGIVVTPVDQRREIQYRMNNIGITGGLLYNISLLRFSHLAGASLQWELGLGSGKADHYDNAGATYFSYRVLYRLEYAAAASVRLFAQPSFTGPFSSEYMMNKAIEIRPLRFGFGFGLVKEL